MEHNLRAAEELFSQMKIFRPKSIAWLGKLIEIWFIHAIEFIIISNERLFYVFRSISTPDVTLVLWARSRIKTNYLSHSYMEWFPMGIAKHAVISKLRFHHHRLINIICNYMEIVRWFIVLASNSYRAERQQPLNRMSLMRCEKVIFGN